jgi:hypothetical protein
MASNYLNSWSGAGVAIIDEKITFSESRKETIGGVDYYVSWLSNLPDAIIADATQSTYGAWTAVEQGGDRQTIQLSGVPGVSGVEVAVLIESGAKILSLSSSTLYFRYMGHGLIERRPVKRIFINRFLEASEGAADLYVAPVPFNCGVNYFDFRINSRAVASGTATLQLRTAISGGGTSVNMAFGTVGTSARNSSGVYALSDSIDFETDEVFCVRATGGLGFGDIEINLYSL